jgi:hypothetical protein
VRYAQLARPDADRVDAPQEGRGGSFLGPGQPRGLGHIGVTVSDGQPDAQPDPDPDAHSDPDSDAHSDRHGDAGILTADVMKTKDLITMGVKAR